MLLGLALLCANAHGSDPFSQAELDIKIKSEKAAIKYFQDQAHPMTGLVRDAAENFGSTPATNRVASIAATGYGLAVLANGAWRGIVDFKMAQEYSLKTLLFARDHVPRHNGWFLHFIDWESGQRMWASEYSTIDTALFMAGALYAAEVFHQPEITGIVDQLYSDMDFNEMLTNGGSQPAKRTLSMAWTPEHGYTNSQWDMFAEHMILLILGLAHPAHPLPVETWTKWARPVMPLSNGDKVMGYDAALFIHQYSQLYVDFRKFNDGFANYHENGITVSRWHRSLAKDGFWGLSAGESSQGYRVWNPTHSNGTFCIGCAVGSAMYLPKDILGDMVTWAQGAHSSKIWGQYGFVDSLNIDENWYSPKVLGITVGPAFMSLANLDESTSFWKLMMTIPAIKLGLSRAARP